MLKNSKIYLAGHTGLLGSAIKKKIEKSITKNLIYKSSKELDLRDQNETKKFFLDNKPDYVINAAAKVGGIYANINYKAEFIYDNLQIQTNIIHYSHQNKVKKLLFFGSNCIYPKNCEQPIKESEILKGLIEPTNESYAIAKIAGIKMCQYYQEQYQDNFITMIPANLYGPNDHFNEINSHFIPSLIKKIHNAKLKNQKYVELWGTGEPKRELLYVDDAADAAIFLLENYNSQYPINVGSGEELKIKDIGMLIKEIVGFKGEICFNSNYPDGIMKKLLNSEKIKNFGWKPKISLEEGLKKTYEAFLNQQ